MANSTYMNDDDDLKDDDDPYDSLSDRVELSDLGDGTPLPAQSVSPAVSKAIASKLKPTTTPSSLTENDIMKDPLSGMYEKDQQDLNSFRQAKRGSDFISNLGQSFSQLAQGSSTPKQNNDLFDNIGRQNSEMLKSKDEDLDRRQKIVNAIEARKAREATTNNTNAYRNVGLMLRQNQIDSANKSKNDRLDSLNIGKANSLMNSGNLPKETTKLNAARNVQTLIDGIRSGDITDTKNVRAQLSNMIATIDFGTPGGVSDRQAMGVDNLYSKLNDLKNKMTYDGQLSGTISPEYLKQLESEGHALGDRAAKNYAIGSKSILQGADLSGGDPDANPGQIHKLVTQRAKSFLSQNGYDPETGEPLNREKSGGFINSANAAGPKTKTVGNDTYMKVDGGWQLVKGGQ